MNIKVLRVCINGQRASAEPVKTGDVSGSGEGKFEADGLLTQEQLRLVKARTMRLRAAEVAIRPQDIQELFASTLASLLRISPCVP